ncbi:MAG: hypothetical protein JKY89_11815 [Immundisolibacteraceae bacterium]|nr:hypothetical protein [Immundisolibacteraceae bacterium]
MLGTLAWMIIALAAGLLSMKLSKPARVFPADWRKVNGAVIAINKTQADIRDRLSSVRDLGCLHRPIIEYQCGNRFWFEADLDAQQFDLKVGDSVTVLLVNNNPLVACLDIVVVDDSKLPTVLMATAITTWLAGLYQFMYAADAVTIDNSVFVTTMVTGLLLGVMGKCLKNPLGAESGFAENAIEVID